MPRTSELSVMSLAQLERLIEKRRGGLSKLERRRASLQRKVDAIDEKIRRMGGNGAVRLGGRGRPRNEQSLAAVMETVLGRSTKPMKVAAIVDAVQAAGYRSSSPNFRSIVNQQLIKNKQFTAAERGYYQLKK